MKTHNINKVIIGLSGGVDSAVSAWLLKQKGYQVNAVYIQCWDEPGCRANQDREDALKVALSLNLPFQVIDFSKEYKEQILNYFYDEYELGRTPNPDILCNSVIKFGLFYDWAMGQGYNFIATGHYARIVSSIKYQVLEGTDIRIGNKVIQKTKYHLGIPKDIHKDQTYFLYQITQEKLEHILFPLGGYLKSEVREIAKREQLPVADKPDSMGICFVGDINVPEFLKQKFGIKKGEVQLLDGTVVGEHEGYYLFTVGKRGNWKRKAKIENSIFKGDRLPKLYVIDIRPKENVVVVGERQEAEKNEFRVKNLKLINCKNNNNDLYVRIRNTGELLPAKITQRDKKTWHIHLEKPEFGISAGQSCVVYQRQEEWCVIIGGGVITK